MAAQPFVPEADRQGQRGAHRLRPGACRGGHGTLVPVRIEGQPDDELIDGLLANNGCEPDGIVRVGGRSPDGQQALRRLMTPLRDRQADPPLPEIDSK